MPEPPSNQLGQDSQVQSLEVSKFQQFDFRGADILSVEQFQLNDIARIFEIARGMEDFAAGRKLTRVLEGAVLGNLFFEPSTRTRLSFGSAFNRLGGTVRDVVGFQFSSIVKGESLFDTSRVISGYTDLMVVRHPQQGSVAEFAAATEKPVINGGDGPGEHPTQALLDLFTVVKEIGVSDLADLSGISIALVGDLKYGRTVHSLAKLLSLLENVNFRLIAPEQLCLPSEIYSVLEKKNHGLYQTEDLEEGIHDVDIIYMTRIQEERFSSKAEYEQYRGRFVLNREIFKRCCRNDTAIMHPLPRDDREGAKELDNDLNDHPRLAIFRQTDNGVPIRMALFALILDVVDRIHETEREAPWLRQKG